MSLLALVLVPVLAAALMPLLQRLARWLPAATAIVVLAETLGFEFALIGDFHAYDGIPAARACLPGGMTLLVDGFALLILVTIGVVGLAAAAYSVAYMKRYGAPGAYFALLLLMIAGLNGLVLTTDLFTLYLFLEVAAIASYALIAFGRTADQVEAAIKYLLLSAVATTLILLALALVWLVGGTLDLQLLAAAVYPSVGDQPLLGLCLAFFLVGFGLKAALAPFHAWLPDAHPAAPAPISALLSGVVIKVAGVYALARVAYGVFDLDPAVQSVLLALGLLSMVGGALLALGQTDYKRLLAYSSISQVGYIAVGLACGTEAALLGALFHLVNHALFKALLFLDAGAIEQSTGTRDLTKLAGLGHRLPLTTLTTTVGTFSIAGIPPFNGFWSKLLIIIGLVQAGWMGTAATAVGVSILTLWYFLLVHRRAFFGMPDPATAAATPVPAVMAAVTFCLALLCLLLGLAAPVVVNWLVGPGYVALRYWSGAL